MERNIEDIVLSQLSGEKLSEEETLIFQEWYRSQENRFRYDSLLRIKAGIRASGPVDIDTAGAWSRVHSQTKRQPLLSRAVRYAAVILLPLGMAGAIYVTLKDRSTATEQITDASVKPGTGKAVITRADGKVVVFTETGEMFGNAAIDQDAIHLNASVVHYSEDDATPGDSAREKEQTYDNIEIPRAGYFELVLSDGTHVWLNSETKMRYPTVFRGKERVVDLIGEAYFDVAPDAGRPFVVRTADCDIKVTGTRFNVRSYAIGSTATTLVEGAVEVGFGASVRELLPNQQALISDGTLTVEEVDVETIIAWQQGAFLYKDTTLGHIMEELARWYDIEVVWDDPQLSSYRFSAWFSRKSRFDEIIGILEKTGVVRLSLTGDKLSVSAK